MFYTLNIAESILKYLANSNNISKINNINFLFKTYSYYYCSKGITDQYSCGSTEYFYDPVSVSCTEKTGVKCLNGGKMVCDVYNTWYIYF